VVGRCDHCRASKHRRHRVPSGSTYLNDATVATVAPIDVIDSELVAESDILQRDRLYLWITGSGQV